ncbi:MAG: hypothetical protein QOI78_2694, partial [Actinomycetota bacterium]|nr:hypothetical protein [Actinomycetota bacterium]
VFLHGRGESAGDGLSERSLMGDLVTKAIPLLASEGGLPSVNGRPFPFLVACPQVEKFWKPHLDDVIGLVDDLIANRGAASSQCYVTGISMGAFASWSIAARAPDRFAAHVPVSGGVPSEAVQAGEVPAWVFAGDADRYYPIADVRDGLGALSGRRSELTLTVVPNAGHEDSFWNQVYARSYLYEWLLSHRTAA